MARLLDDAASDHMDETSTPVAAVPLSMACWFNCDVQQDQAFMSICDASATDNMFFLAPRDNSGVNNDHVYASTFVPGAIRTAATSTTWNANTWNHACGVWAATNDRRVYLNGGGKGTNALAATPTGIDRIGLGALVGLIPGQFLSGMLAEAAIWNVAFSDDEAAEAASGIKPFKIRPQNLVAYWPLLGEGAVTEYDYVSDYNLSLTGTAVAAHPFIYGPRRRMVAAGAAISKMPRFDHYYRMMRSA